MRSLSNSLAPKRSGALPRIPSHEAEPPGDLAGLTVGDRPDPQGDGAVLGSVAIREQAARQVEVAGSRIRRLQHAFIAGGQHDHMTVAFGEMVLPDLGGRRCKRFECGVDGLGGRLAG